MSPKPNTERLSKRSCLKPMKRLSSGLSGDLSPTSTPNSNRRFAVPKSLRSQDCRPKKLRRGLGRNRGTANNKVCPSRRAQGAFAMRKLYVTLNGKRAGPYPEAKVAAALRKGKLRGADFEDAETGEIVLEWDVVAPPSLPP